MISPEILRRYPYFAAADDEGLRSLGHDLRGSGRVRRGGDVPGRR